MNRMASIMVLALAAVAASGPPAADADLRCRFDTRLYGPSSFETYVRAEATGARVRVPVPDPHPTHPLLGDPEMERHLPPEVLAYSAPDSAEAWEFRVLGVAAHAGADTDALPVPGDLLLVAPWEYDSGCAPQAWEGGWIGAGEETVLTLPYAALGNGETALHVRGGHAAYPQGWVHLSLERDSEEIRAAIAGLTGEAFSEYFNSIPRSVPEGALAPAEFLDLVSRLPARIPGGGPGYAAEFADGWVRALEVAATEAGSPGNWWERYPVTRILSDVCGPFNSPGVSTTGTPPRACDRTPGLPSPP